MSGDNHNQADPLDLDAIEALYPELEDWEFIAHARVDLPALVAEVRRLRAQVERVGEIEASVRRYHLTRIADEIAEALRDE